MRLIAAAALAYFCCAPLAGQAPDLVVVNTRHPRLFLNAARLRLLKRERDRATDRWRRFETLVTGGSALPEPGFALALYYQVTGDRGAGGQALDWAAAPGRDLRQLALVFDWCQPLMTGEQRSGLAARIAGAMAANSPDRGLTAVSARVLAAVALFDDFPDSPQAQLERTVHTWWEGSMAPALKAGRDAIPRDDAYALFELLHALRDSTDLDLREACPRYFLNLPIGRLMSYYPAAYTGPENEFRAGIQSAPGPPDQRLAALSRAADLAMVAYDADAPESQALQGWLMHDLFTMRDAFGAPYEFLWANPYQPGLSYYHLPLVFYDSDAGRLFVRSSWEDSAAWFGYWNGAAQTSVNGRVSTVDAAGGGPERIGDAVVSFGPRAFRVRMEEGQRLFVVALEPHRAYRIAIGGQKPFVAPSDNGGVLELHTPAGKEVGVVIQ